MNNTTDTRELLLSLNKLEDRINNFNKNRKESILNERTRLQLAGLTSAQQKALSTGNPGKWHDKLDVCKIGGINMPPEYCGRKADLDKSKIENTEISKKSQSGLIEKAKDFMMDIITRARKNFKAGWNSYNRDLKEFKEETVKTKESRKLFSSFVSASESFFQNVIGDVLNAIENSKVPFISRQVKKTRTALYQKLGIPENPETVKERQAPLEKMKVDLEKGGLDGAARTMGKALKDAENFITDIPKKPQNALILAGVVVGIAALGAGIVAASSILKIGKKTHFLIESSLENHSKIAGLLPPASSPVVNIPKIGSIEYRISVLDRIFRKTSKKINPLNNSSVAKYVEKIKKKGVDFLNKNEPEFMDFVKDIKESEYARKQFIEGIKEGTKEGIVDGTKYGLLGASIFIPVWNASLQIKDNLEKSSSVETKEGFLSWLSRIKDAVLASLTVDAFKRDIVLKDIREHSSKKNKSPYVGIQDLGESSSQVLANHKINTKNIEQVNILNAIKKTSSFDELEEINTSLKINVLNNPPETWKILNKNNVKEGSPSKKAILAAIKYGLKKGYSLGTLIGQLTAGGVYCPPSLLRQIHEEVTL